VASAAKSVSLAEIAALIGREVEGDPGLMVSGVAALESAGPGDIAFVRSPGYAAAVAASRAGALILPGGMDAGARSAIRSPNPALDFARVVEHLAPSPRPAPGPHPNAHVSPDAQVDASACLAPGVVLEGDASVGPRSVLHGNVSVYSGARIGADCLIHSGVVIREGSVIGDRVVLQPGVVIGGDGFGYVADEQGRPRHVPHVGRVVVEDDVEIGANSTIDRGTLGETRIRRGAKIDNLVMIAHNCDVGEDAIIVAQTGLSGSTVVGRGAMIMAQAGSSGHLEIGAGAFVGVRAGLHKDVAPGARVFGAPPQEEYAWHRATIALTQLPATLRRLRAVERELGLRGGARPSRDDAKVDPEKE
jgi:UDP-3-O-[3-hydroxymyristoyl] glucosamine N-acyltransferase